VEFGRDRSGRRTLAVAAVWDEGQRLHRQTHEEGERVFDTVIVDLDGTLIDSTYHQTVAWFRAFQVHDLSPALWRIHRANGMGGDLLVAEIAGSDVERDIGDSLRQQWKVEYEALVPEVVAFDGAAKLLAFARDGGLRTVIASSSPPDLVERYQSMLGGEQVADAWTTSEDVDSTKPAPDLLVTALARVGGVVGAAVGDSVWDVKAAAAVPMPCFTLRTGGFGVDELRAAGAADVYDTHADLIMGLEMALRG
jgi:beta-phosphoglucomutase-like phosphatase (HAD superfamily)